MFLLKNNRKTVLKLTDEDIKKFRESMTVEVDKQWDQSAGGLKVLASFVQSYLNASVSSRIEFQRGIRNGPLPSSIPVTVQASLIPGNSSLGKYRKSLLTYIQAKG